MQNTNNERANFGSKIGAILAAAGSAVGLGNIWRFPYEAGNHGGAAFILIYLGCVFLLGLPIMIAEFTIGRHSKASTGKAYQVCYAYSRVYVFDGLPRTVFERRNYAVRAWTFQESYGLGRKRFQPFVFYRGVQRKPYERRHFQVQAL